MNNTALTIAVTIHMVGLIVITVHSATHNRSWPPKLRLIQQWIHIGLWTLFVALGFALFTIDIGAGILSLLGLERTP